jgi:3-isopropylmalate/(R)-2-methylmalate dehydratase small subunit
MENKLSGKVFKVGDDINTDYIIPGKYLDLYEPEELGRHAFEGLGDEYPEMLKGHKIILAGRNFGLGSAREQAPNALKGAGVQAIIAISFARIFFRNAVNVGIATIECPDAVDAIVHGNEVEIDMDRGIIVSQKKTFHFRGFSDAVRELLNAGGMVPYLRKKLNLVSNTV